MSCRLLRDGLAAAPLFESERRQSAPAAFLPQLPATSFEAGEVEQLRHRVSEVEAAAARSIEEARQQGIQEGEQLGYGRAMAAAQPVLERMGAAVANLSGLRSRVRAEAERELVELSLAVARRILRRELSVDPDAVQGLVRAALEKLQSRDIARVRVSPDHEAPVRRCLTDAHAGNVDLIPDASLQPGDVIFETAHGDLDASIETQLREIERGFADKLR